jgi:hypothetical protein
MTAGFILILIVVAGYLAAHAVSEWLGRRHLIVSGAEYLMLGILLGPQVSGLIRTSVVESFTPFLTLALGWIGAALGTHFYLPRLVRTRAILFRVAFLEAILSTATVAGVMALVFGLVFETTPGRSWTPAIALGAIAAASSPAAVRIVAARIGRRSRVTHQLEETVFIDALIAITVFSLLLCFQHPVPLGLTRAPTTIEWAVISIGIGLIGGALFHLFLGLERDVDRLFIGMVGAITLASGAAAYLRLSPLLPALLIGAILVNTSRNRETITRLLQNAAAPIYFVLLIFAGTMWQPATRPLWLVPVLLFLLLRVVTKLGSARLAARLSGRLRTLGNDWGRGLLGQGALPVAIAVNYRLHDSSFLPNVVFTAAIISVLLTDLLSGRLAQTVVFRQLQRVTGQLGRILPGESRA